MSAERFRADGVSAPTTGAPFGEPVVRTEDARLLRGRGSYVANVTLAGQLHVAFVRSTVAHARVLAVEGAEAAAAPGVVTVATGADDDICGHVLAARSELAGIVVTEQPVLATDVVRHVGEAVAAVVATSRTAAVDAAEMVDVSYERLDAHVHAVGAHEAPTSHPVHAAAPDNLALSRTFEAGDVTGAFANAAVVVERTFTTNRHGGVPLEGRGTIAEWDTHGRLTVHATSQVPYLHRRALAGALGISESRIRVLVGDVGGGFGIKASTYPEDVVVPLLARRLGAPVGWTETRSEHMSASMHARDHHYRARAAFAADGELLAVDATLHANVGAYSTAPWTAGIEPLMAGGLLTGPYKLSHYRCDVRGVFTNTAATGPFRGVARPATVYVMERLMDEAAVALDIDRVELRRRNLVSRDDVPWTAPTRLVHDSTTYVDCLDAVVSSVGPVPDVGEGAGDAAGSGRLVGVGFACYNELTGLGQKASAGPRLPFRTGHESASVRIAPDGSVHLTTGVTSQGQGTETTMAQVAAAELGVAHTDVRVVMGDTDALSYGLGAFASRQGVIGSGAVTLAARAVVDKARRIAGHLMEADPEWLAVTDGLFHTADAPSVGVTWADVAEAAYLMPQRLPDGVEPGLDETRFYDPMTGTFAAGALAAVVAVDTETGEVEVLRLVCAEDTGRMINPAVVTGQVVGAIAHGVSGALFEHFVYDDDGQLLTATLMDYQIASAAEMPPIETQHIVEPAHNLNGIRGVGEGGTLGPYAAIANAVCDALRPLGVTIDTLPLTPAAVTAAIGAGVTAR